MLDSDEAARRLGVKLATLYAYVSRGLLDSHRSPDGRRSLFVLDDVEQLARRARGGRRVETRLATVTTSVTQLREDGPAYRGTPTVALATTASFEEVAEILWRSGPPGPTPWEPAPLPDVPELGPSDRLRWAVLMSGAADPLRSDRTPAAVLRAARRLVATMVSSLGPGTAPGGELQLDGGNPRPGSVAARLTAALCRDPSPGVGAAVNAALVLLADNELATSTVAVRVAASTRADLYDAMQAGLATLAGPLHGGASEQAYDLLSGVERIGARALDEPLRWHGRLPGFDPTVYEAVDPRFEVLHRSFDRLASPAQREVLRTVVDLASAHGAPPPNVDLGIAAVLYAAGMPRDAGRTVFAVARVAGWTAHYLEEMGERPLRFRTRAVYSAG